MGSDERRLQMSKSMQGPDWHTSPVYLDLLSKFANGRDIAQVMDWQYLKDALGEPTKLAIDRFIDEGALVPCTLQEGVGRLLTVSDLKGLLKERELRLSGNKADLIDRLVEADRTAAEEIVGKRQIMKCSNEALKLLEAFEEERDAAETEAKTNTHRFLLERNVRDAYREYVQYTRRYQSPDFPSSPHQAEEVETTLSTSPDALSGLDASALAHLQAAVAMSQLWYGEDPLRWLPESFPVDAINLKAAASYLTRAAGFKRQVAQASEYDWKVRIVFSPYDVDSCGLCKQYNGKEFTPADVPNFPLRGCTSETGCMCELETVWDDSHSVLEFTFDELDREGTLPNSDPVDRLRKLKEMLDLGLISQQEYDQKKQQILEEL
jgi:hypothetical protein